jgi:cytochrome c5
MERKTLMSMNVKVIPVFIAAAAVVLAGAGVYRAAAQELDPETKARVERFEKGPATIDVSKYPDGLKENYEVFSTKCAQCHKLSRPINSDYALPDEWSRYIKRMMNKPGSGISSSEGKKIYEFLAYDSSVRKKAMLDEKLAKATPADKTTAEAKIKELHDKYDGK